MEDPPGFNKILQSPEAKNILAWNIRPPPNVASNIMKLQDYNSGFDFCTQKPSELQTYASYSTMATSYICSIKMTQEREEVAAAPVVSKSEAGWTPVKSNIRRLNTPQPEHTTATSDTQSTVSQDDTIPQPSTSTPSSVPLHTSAPYVPIHRVTATTILPNRALKNVPYTREFKLLEDAGQQPSPQGWLASAVKNDWGSFFDVAPMSRTLLLAHSIEGGNPSNDITPLTFIRNISTKYLTTKIATPKITPSEYQVIAMYFDTFINYVRGGYEVRHAIPPGFEPYHMDENWIAIPVHNDIPYATAKEYITAFLDSGLTWGSVNNYYEYSTTDDPPIRGTLQTIPASATAHISGPKNAILVVTNRSNPSRTFNLQGTEIPVYQGKGEAIVPTDWGLVWQKYFVDNNRSKIAKSLMHNWNYMLRRIAVGVTAGMALAQAAEHIPTLRPGMFIHPQRNKQKYDLSRPLVGAFLFRDHGHGHLAPLAHGSPYQASILNPLLDCTLPDLQHKLMGFNLAAISAAHIPPSGIQKLTRSADHGIYCIENSQPDEANSAITYTTPVSNSLNRIAVYMGLIQTNDTEYQFWNASAIPAWLHMLALAQSCNMAAFLMLQDIAVCDWTGYRYRDIGRLKVFIGNWTYTHHEQLLLHKMCANWDNNWIPSYFETSHPYDNRDWGQNSPVPAHLTMQWTEKMNLLKMPETHENSIFIEAAGETISAVELTNQNKRNKLYMLSSVETTRYLPMMIDQSRPYKKVSQARGTWIEQFRFLSLYTSKEEYNDDRKWCETTTPTESLSERTRERRLYVINTALRDPNWKDWRQPEFSPIHYPNTADWQTIVSLAKNCVLESSILFQPTITSTNENANHLPHSNPANNPPSVNNQVPISTSTQMPHVENAQDVPPHVPSTSL